MQISLPPDQKFIIIHLSDMHLWHGRPNAVMNRTEALAAAISSLQPLSERKFLIVFSGDIAFSGSKSEYEMAGSFFSDLASYLDQMGISEFETFIVPGNHDCDFSLNNKAREILLGEIYKGVEIDEAVINICVSVQQNFFDFKRSLFSEIEQDWHPLLWRGSIDVFGFKVVINGFNTSWVSKRHEDYGKLYMPANTLGVEATSADLVISVFHHPYSWLPVENKNEYKSLVERSSDFSFTGHEHVGESLSVSSGGERLQNYIIAGALQENHDQSVSEFNAVVFDITTMRYMSYHFLYEDNKYNLNQVDGDWQEYRSSSRKLPNSFQLNKQYIQQTNDNGYALSNGERRLFVDDLFIFPNLREIVPKDQIKKIDPKLGKSDSHILLGKNIIDWINRTERAIIYGPDRSGKTTLARKIQAEMLSDKLVPLVLDCDQIGRYTKDTPEKIIKAAIAQQFGPEVHEEFMQLGINNRIILIDNFSSNNLNDHARDDLISQVNNFSKRVLVFSSDDISVDSIAIIKIVSSLKEYKRIEILPFGHNLRSELVRKWYAPTDPYSVNIDDLEKKCVAVERLITAMAANNLAVTYPLQVLVMLQNVESSAGSDISSSSYASFCEVQIKTELNKISQSYGFDQGTLHSILEEVAYEMHKSGIRSYSIAEYLEQLEKYSSLYFLPAKPADVIDAARAVGILSVQQDQVGFVQGYQNYYFIASKINTMLQQENPEAQAEIENLCQKIYLGDNANIIIFLAFLSKSKLLLDVMMKHSRDLLKGVSYCDFDNATSFASMLVDKIPKVTLVLGDPSQNRALSLKTKDRDEYGGEFQDGVNEEQQLEENRDEMDATLQNLISINSVFKTIDVIGHILKVYPGTMQGEVKVALARECYDLTMRGLGVMYKLFEDNLENIVSFIREILEEKRDGHEDQVSKEEWDLRSKGFVFQLLVILGQTFLTRLSGAIGAQKLIMVFDRLLEDAPVSYRLIDFSVRLSAFSKIEHSKVREINRLTRNKLVANMILLRMVTNFFYLYNVDRATVQRICNELGIDYKQALVSSVRGEDNKRNTSKGILG